MTSKDIIKIINACKSAGVESFNFGGLEMRFRTGDAANPGVLKFDRFKPPTDQELENLKAEATEQSVEEEVEEHLSQMQIDDPTGFEELLVQRELTFSGSDENEAALD